MIKWFQNKTVLEVVMPTITLKNIPQDLYETLKMRAKRNRRSLNSEILVILEESVLPKPVDVETILAEAKALREQTPDYFLTEEVLRKAKDEGRP